MKRYRQILSILVGFLLLAIAMLTFQVYKSGIEGRRVCKQKADVSLKSVAELWAYRELDKLETPYIYEGGEPKAKGKKRRMVLAEGKIVVEVDSVKEARKLFSSWGLSAKINALLLLSTPDVVLLNEMWQKEMNGIHPYCFGALILQSKIPSEKKEQKFIAGDSTLMINKHKLGTYYLDNMYFLQLKSYLSLPSLWQCVNWREDGIVFFSAIIVICMLIFAFLQNRKKNDKYKINNPDDIVKCISEKKYQIGEVLFDEEASTLTFKGQNSLKCPMQAYKLLSAFIHTEKHFLSNNRIIEICSWCPTDIGIDAKRRVTISQLRKLLDCKKSHVNLESGKNAEKELGFYLVVKEQ